MPVEELDEVARKLRSKTPVLPVTVRTFLSWFGAQRRGVYVVQRIKAELEEVSVITYPDFEQTWVDDPIGFLLSGTAEADQAQSEEESVSSEEETSNVGDPADQPDGPPPRRADPLYRVSKLKAANRPVTSVTLQQELSFIVTTMMVTGFSQLPVMTDGRNPRGVVSWKSIAQYMALGVKIGCAADCMDPYEPFLEVRSDSSLFEAIPVVMRHDFVLVRGRENRITGIITQTDLTELFRDLTQPFLILNEIENMLRDLISRSFTIESIRRFCETSISRRGHPVETVEDMNFGEYIFLLDNPERWQTLGILVDRGVFCSQLNRVRELRNDTMHFDPEGPSDIDRLFLRDFAKFLAEIQNMQRHGSEPRG